MQYVELHARSAFSFLAGASPPDALAYACVEHQVPAMALLDRNGIYGSARFHLTAKANDITAHVGAELSVADTPKAPASYYPVLVQNRAGYQNLCCLITKTKLRAPKNTPTAATLSELKEHASGLICLTGDEEGPLAEALFRGGKAAARRLLERLTCISAARTCMWSCSATSGRNRSIAITSRSSLLVNRSCPCLRPTECSMPRLPIAKFWML